MPRKVLTLNIKRRWFAEIVAVPARKKIEYRSIKPYYDVRFRGLMTGPFRLRLLNGMLRPVPEAIVMVKKLVRNRLTGDYELHLGRVLSVKYWDRKREVSRKR